MIDPKRGDNRSQVHMLAFGTLGLVGAYLLVLSLDARANPGRGVSFEKPELLDNPVAVALLVLTPAVSAMVGRLWSRILRPLPILVAVCGLGGMVEGGLVALIGTLATQSFDGVLAGLGQCFALTTFGGIIGSLCSLLFLPGMMYVAVAVRRLTTVRRGSVLAVLLGTSVAVAVLLCCVAAITLSGSFIGPELQAALPKVLLVATLGALAAHLSAFAKIRSAFRRSASLRRVAAPTGMQVRGFVDFGIGEHAYEDLAPSCTLRGAPDVRLEFTGDPASAARLQKRALVVDLVSLLIIVILLFGHA